MRTSSFLAATAAVVTLFGASMANAQTWVEANVAQVDMKSTKDFNQSPSGTALELAVGQIVYDNNDFRVGVVAGVSYNDVSAQQVFQTCDVLNCGFDEFDTEVSEATWSGSLGIKVEHPAGPFTVFVSGGLRVTQVTESSSYDTGGAFPTFYFEESGYAVGPYYGAGISYPVRNNLALALKYEHTDLTSRSWSSTWGSGDTGFNQTNVSLGLIWTLGN